MIPAPKTWSSLRIDIVSTLLLCPQCLLVSGMWLYIFKANISMALTLCQVMFVSCMYNNVFDLEILEEDTIIIHPSEKMINGPWLRI